MGVVIYAAERFQKPKQQTTNAIMDTVAYKEMVAKFNMIKAARQQDEEAHATGPIN